MRSFSHPDHGFSPALSWAGREQSHRKPWHCDVLPRIHLRPEDGHLSLVLIWRHGAGICTQAPEIFVSPGERGLLWGWEKGPHWQDRPWCPE